MSWKDIPYFSEVLKHMQVKLTTLENMKLNQGDVV